VSSESSAALVAAILLAADVLLPKEALFFTGIT
jgi:hypothetical protein